MSSTARSSTCTAALLCPGKEGPYFVTTRFARELTDGSGNDPRILTNCACCPGAAEVTECLPAAEALPMKGEAAMAKRQAVIRLRGLQFPTARDAVRHAQAGGGGEAIHLGGKNLVVAEGDADRLAAAGVSFAY